MADESSRTSRWKLALLVGVPVAVVSVYLGYLAYQRRQRRKAVKRQETRETEPLSDQVGSEEAHDETGQPVTTATAEQPKAKSLLEQSREAKVRGNEFFKQKNKEAAIACYEEAVRLCPKENTGDLAVYYHNIAACLEAMAGQEQDKDKKCSLFEQVVDKCTTSLEYNPRYVKPMQRRMRACQALGRRREAFMDANRLTIADQSNNPVSDIPATLLNELGTELAQEAFPKLGPLRPPKQMVLAHFLEFAWKDDISLLHLQTLWKAAHTAQPEKKEEKKEDEIQQNEDGNQANKDGENTDEERKEDASENDEEEGEEKEEEETRTDEPGTLDDESDKSADASASPSAKPTNNDEGLNGLFAEEPFVKVASMYSQNNFDDILGELTLAVEKGHPVFRPHALLLRGSFRFLWRMYKDALDDFQEVADTDGLPAEMIADAHVKRAGVYNIMSEKELCDKELQLALKANTDQADVYIVRAKTNVESEDPKVLVSAQEDLKRALSLAPNTPLVYYYLGLVVHRTGMVFQNLQLAQSVQAGLNPQLMPMTEVVQLSKEAADWFKKGYEKFPNCSEGLVVYAMFLQDTQEMERSEQLIHKAIQLEPENGLAHVILSTVYLAQQESEKALKSLETAVKLDTSCIQAFELLASIEMQKGNQQRALDLHDMAIKNSRSFQEVQQILMTKEVIKAQRQACHEYGVDPVSLFEQRMSQLQGSGPF